MQDSLGPWEWKLEVEVKKENDEKMLELCVKMKSSKLEHDYKDSKAFYDFFVSNSCENKLFRAGLTITKKLVDLQSDASCNGSKSYTSESNDSAVVGATIYITS